MFSIGGNGDVVNCVEARDGAIGYVDNADESTNSYSAIVEGVDPETNDLKTLVRCGHYRWWGPLAGGRPNDPALSDRGNVTPTASETAHRFALSSVPAFASFKAYLPFGTASQGGVAIRKNVTDGSYTLRFRPRAAPRSRTRPATSSAPSLEALVNGGPIPERGSGLVVPTPGRCRARLRIVTSIERSIHGRVTVARAFPLSCARHAPPRPAPGVPGAGVLPARPRRRPGGGGRRLELRVRAQALPA